MSVNGLIPRAVAAAAVFSHWVYGQSTQASINLHQLSFTCKDANFRGASIHPLVSLTSYKASANKTCTISLENLVHVITNTHPFMPQGTYHDTFENKLPIEHTVFARLSAPCGCKLGNFSVAGILSNIRITAPPNEC